MSTLTLRELIDIPRAWGADDYVLRPHRQRRRPRRESAATDRGVRGHRAAGQRPFDRALVARSPTADGTNEQEHGLRFSHGSASAAGKSRRSWPSSSPLLGDHPAARAKGGLSGADPSPRFASRLSGRRFLLGWPYHGGGGRAALESGGVLGGYVEHDRCRCTPSAPLPAVHVAATGYSHGRRAVMRAELGDDPVPAGISVGPLATARTGAGATTWSKASWQLADVCASYDAATSPTAGTDERRQAQQALIATHFSSSSPATPIWLPLDEGPRGDRRPCAVPGLRRRGAAAGRADALAHLHHHRTSTGPTARCRRSPSWSRAAVVGSPSRSPRSSPASTTCAAGSGTPASPRAPTRRPSNGPSRTSPAGSPPSRWATRTCPRSPINGCCSPRTRTPPRPCGRRSTGWTAAPPSGTCCATASTPARTTGERTPRRSGRPTRSLRR